MAITSAGFPAIVLAIQRNIMEQSDTFNSVEICPHLGMKHDPGTSYAYPTPGNYCGHAQPRAAPTQAHQEACCFGAAYAACPVYQQSHGRPFPVQLKAKEISHRKPLASSYLLVTLALLLISGGWWIFNAAPAWLLPRDSPSVPLLIPVTSLSRTPLATETSPSAVPTKTAVAPTKTPLRPPTVTPTLAQPTRTLEFPFKVGEQTYLVHRVREGENFEVLEETYVTSTGVILALNDSLSSPLWVNSVIVIAPGVQAVDPELPAFRPYEVTEKVSIDELARQLNAHPDLLRYYNNCSENCRLSVGDWLIVPYPKE